MIYLEELQADTQIKASYNNLPKDYTLEKALKENRIIIADGDVINGQEQWMEFAEKTSEGKMDSVSVVYYYTLGDKSQDSVYGP